MKKNIDWPEVIKSYHSRTCTFAEFAEQRSINPATLRYHLDKDRRGKTGNFIPVSLPSQNKSSEEVVIEFSSGLRLSIRG
jgi:hypothetical protein